MGNTIIIMECYLVKDDNGILRPARQDDADKIKKLKMDESYKCVITMPRNIGHHRKFYALIDLALTNLHEDKWSHITTTEDLLFVIKILMGHVDRILIDGQIHERPKSISFAKMDQAEFQDFYQRTIDLVLKHFLSGVNREQLEDEVLAFI